MGLHKVIRCWVIRVSLESKSTVFPRDRSYPKVERTVQFFLFIENNASLETCRPVVVAPQLAIVAIGRDTELQIGGFSLTKRDESNQHQEKRPNILHTTQDKTKACKNRLFVWVLNLYQDVAIPVR